MKKQILILVLFVLAAFVSVNKSYGQTSMIAGAAPRGIGCVDDAMHPLAGKQYIYQAASNQTGNYTFWATQDANFITTAASVTTTNMTGALTVAGGGLLAAGANYVTPSATDNIALTWSDATLHVTTATTPTFVVVNQDGTCANNLKVWSITPIVAFTVDIKNMTHLTPTTLPYDDTTEKQCFDKVRGATYTGGQLQYDFGTQVLYWEVVAANFSASYTPTFTLTGLGNGQTAVIEWAYDAAFTNPVTVTSGVASVTAASTSVTNTSAGVSIYARVTITNHTYEGILPAGTPITLAVDGQNSVGDWDIDNGNGTTCVLATGADQKDTATQTLDPRPTVTPAVTVPVTTFVGTNATN